MDYPITCQSRTFVFIVFYYFWRACVRLTKDLNPSQEGHAIPAIILPPDELPYRNTRHGAATVRHRPPLNKQIYWTPTSILVTLSVILYIKTATARSRIDQCPPQENIKSHWMPRPTTTAPPAVCDALFFVVWIPLPVRITNIGANGWKIAFFSWAKCSVLMSVPRR